MSPGSETVTICPRSVEEMLAAALGEDLGERGDITTALTLRGARGAPARGRVIAKAEGRLSGVALFAKVFDLLDGGVRVEVQRGDGQAVRPGDVVLALSGPAASLLEGERTALNVLGRLSGVATLTARFVAAVAGTRAAIVDTRKTTPGWRLAEKQAVVHGGGKNHRIGLFDEVLLKENHFAMTGEGYRALVQRVKAAAPPGTRVTAEARDLAEAQQVADGGADVVLLDNFGVEGLAAVVAALARHPRRARLLLEASGGVTLSNVATFAATGVDRISVGALTHSAPALDLSMLLETPPA